MYTGTLIDDLIKAVQRAEADTHSEDSARTGTVELRMFMARMQGVQTTATRSSQVWSAQPGLA